MPLFGQPGERIAYALYPSFVETGGPPLVLLHGFTASSAAFDANVEALREHFTVVTVDLLGHGASESPANAAPYAPKAAIARLLALFDELGFARVLLCGHSLGGALALRLALDAPERLTGLVVMNSMSAAGTPQWRENARAGMNEMAWRARAEGTAFLKQTRLYPAHSKRLDERSRQLLVEAFEQLTPEGMAGTAEELTANVNAWERHPELKVPLLVIVGDRDRDFVASAPGFVSRFPAELVRTAVLPEAGHAANIEQPRGFEEALAAFAREIGVLPTPETGQGPGTLARLGGAAVTTLGVLLVLTGIGLLGASFLLTGNSSSNDQAVLAAQPASNATREVVTAVAGTRVAGPGAAQPSSIPAVASPAQQSPSNTPVPTATPAAAATQASQVAPPATPTPTLTPQPTATPITPTPAPDGPYAGISGPPTAAAGETVTFVSTSAPGSDILRWNWSTSGVLVPQPNLAVLRVAFPASGCQSVSLTVVFKSGVQRSATQVIAVGGASCQ